MYPESQDYRTLSDEEQPIITRRLTYPYNKGVIMNKERIKEEMVTLRAKLATAEIQANHVIGLLPTKYGLPCKVFWHIKEADNELCMIARKMGLEKVGLVELKRRSG